MSTPVQGGIHYWQHVPANHPVRQKRCRWVVVSRTVFNEHSDHVLACPLTRYTATPLDIAVRKTPHNSLDDDSAMIVPMISPILKVELSEAIGRVGTSQMQFVLDRLRILVEAT